jgi:hypothetical protein
MLYQSFTRQQLDQLDREIQEREERLAIEETELHPAFFGFQETAAEERADHANA